MPVLPAPRGVAGGQCQEMWQEEERSNNKGCRSPPICSVLMSEPRSSWTRRDPQCVTAMHVCVYMTIRHKLDQIHNGLVVWETTQNCHGARNIFPSCPQKLEDIKRGQEIALRLHFLFFFLLIYCYVYNSSNGAWGFVRRCFARVSRCQTHSSPWWSGGNLVPASTRLSAPVGCTPGPASCSKNLFCIAAIKQADGKWAPRCHRSLPDRWQN